MRVAVAVLTVVLAYGGIVHLGHLVVDGWPPYPWAPAWLAVYFTSLTVLDPLAAWLLWTGRRAGLPLAAFVLVTDAIANYWATYHVLGPTPLTQIAQAVISVLAVATVILLARDRPVARWRGARP